MNNMLMRVKTKNNPKLSDDQIVEECMDMLLEKFPQIQSYQYERVGDHIMLLLWGNFVVV